MRAWLLVLLFVPFGTASVYDGISWLESYVEEDPLRGQFKQLGDPIPGAGLNPFTWPPAAPVWGTQDVADWRDVGLNEASVRHLATLAALGVGDIYPDPKRGPISLLGEMRSQHDHLDGGAVLSWHLWGLDAAGVPLDDALRLEDEAALVALQQQDGSVPCSPNYGTPSVDCTAWAVIALGGRYEAFDEKAKAFLMNHYHENGGFGVDAPNAQSSVWAGAAVGYTYNSLTEEYLSRLQAADGKYHCVRLEAGCSHAWVTAEVVAFIEGSYPFQHREPPTLSGPRHLQAGEVGTWEASEEVDWHVGEDLVTGRTYSGALQEDATLYAHGDGWAKWEVSVEGEKGIPLAPLCLVVGLLAWATHRRK